MSRPARQSRGQHGRPLETPRAQSCKRLVGLAEGKSFDARAQIDIVGDLHEGAAIGINYRTGAREAEAVAAEVRSHHGKALPLGADIAHPHAVSIMVAELEREFGPVDILVNNAGVMRRGDLGDFDYGLMEGMRGTNVDGLIHVTRAVVEGMKKRGSGRIINLTSIAAHGTAMAGATPLRMSSCAFLTRTALR